MDIPTEFPVTTCSIESMGFAQLNAKDVAKQLFNFAARNLSMDGGFDPMAFFFTSELCYQMSATQFFENSERKDMLSFVLRKAAAESVILGIALVTECWMRCVSDEEKVTGVDNSCAVSDHDDKKEGILVQCEWCDSTQSMITATFDREQELTGIKSIKIHSPTFITEFEGRFANIFPPTRSGGYFQ